MIASRSRSIQARISSRGTAPIKFSPVRLLGEKAASPRFVPDAAGGVGAGGDDCRLVDAHGAAAEQHRPAGDQHGIDVGRCRVPNEGADGIVQRLQMRLHRVDYQKIGGCALLDPAEIGAAKDVGGVDRRRPQQGGGGPCVAGAVGLLRCKARGTHLGEEIHAFGVGADAGTDPGAAEALEAGRLAATKEDAGTVCDSGARVTHPPQFIVGQVRAVREDNTFAQQPDRCHVSGPVHTLLASDAVDFALALSEVDRCQDAALARDRVDEAKQVGTAGIGGMRTEDHPDDALGSAVVNAEKPFEFGESRFTFQATPRRFRYLVADCPGRGREQIGRGVKAQTPFPRQIEDRGLRGAELVDERGHAGAQHLQ